MLLPRDKFEAAFALIKKDSLHGGTSVLVLVSNDVDSLCAARILAGLFHDEFIQYTQKPVSSIEDLLASKQFVTEEVKSVVLINCGGIMPLRNMFLSDLEHPVTAYVIDSHRPFHVQNLEDQVQIILLGGEDEDVSNMDVEDYSTDSTSNSDSTSNTEDSDDDSDSASSAQKKRKRRPENHNGTFYGPSATRILFDLASQLGKSGTELVWLAIIALTDQYIHQRIDDRTYRAEVQFYKDQEAAIVDEAQSRDSQTATEAKIVQSDEFKFFLHRHWNLYDSMLHSAYIASKLGVWKSNGKKKLATLLVEMGMPLDEVKNSYSCMNGELKKVLKTSIHVMGKKYGLNEITYPSFYRNINYRLQISAADVVYAVNALLEHSATGETFNWEKNFWTAYDALSEQKIEHFQEGLKIAINVQQALIQQGNSIIENKSIISTGALRHAFVSGGPDLPIFTKPLALARLGVYITDALGSSSKSKSRKPFVVGALNNTRNTYLLVGLTGYAPSIKHRSPFGYSYEYAQTKTNTRIKLHNFDAAIVEILKDDVKKFVDYLHSGFLA